MSVTEEIKSRLDLVDVVEGYLPLRKSGNAYTGFCPFHQNTRTPSFVVFPQTQTWRCFGACADGGDLFTFMMKKEGWDFKEALKALASRAGVTLAPETPQAKARQAKAERWTGLLGAAADYFHQLFLHAPQAEGARQYVYGRDISEQTVATFKIGFALDSWDNCREHFLAQGYELDDLLAVGLLSHNEERGSTYDRFRNRLMIPIMDVGGDVVGFGARTLDPDGIPKYLNSPQTELFDKSGLLYGLDRAKRHIREARQAVIVEGYMDVMQAWQAGFRNVVAQMGTALTEAQLMLLKRYSKRFVIALDADAAGMKATLRSLEVARQTLERTDEVAFDARGLLRHESRLKADIRVVALPEGEDPDSLIRRDKGAWPVVIAKAEPIVSYVMKGAVAEADLGDAKAKTRVAASVLPLIADLPDPIERDHYHKQLARLLDVDVRALLRMAVAKREAGAGVPAPPAPVVKRSGESVGRGRRNGRWIADGYVDILLREQNFLRLCLENPVLWRQVDRILEAINEPKVTIQDFTDPLDRALFEPIHQWVLRAEFVSLEELCDSLEVVLQERIQELQQLGHVIEQKMTLQIRSPEKLAMSVIDWRCEKIKRQSKEVGKIFSEVGQQQNDENDVLKALYGQQVVLLSQKMKQLDNAKQAVSALSRRLVNETG
ncbi:MAG TPA: DNA primase [Anaerolineae bacterium]|nr:DNA primase [Anaerolineae bacterium]